MGTTTTNVFWLSLFLFLIGPADLDQLTTATDLLDGIVMDELWSHWKHTHNKQYADQNEDACRRDQWMENVMEMMQHNVKHDLGLVSYSKGLNAYADLSWAEFRDQHLSGLLDTQSVESSLTERRRLGKPFNASEVVSVADQVDWREHGLVREVKNQGACGSCWAFSTTGAIEGQYAKQYEKPLEFSEQQLIDCSESFGNHGCHGGLMEWAFEYLERFGLEPENVYPYHAIEERCKYRSASSKVKVKAYATVHSGNEQALKALVCNRGPVAIALDVDQGFQMYRHGIYQSTECSSNQLNHGVLVVGYGSERGSPYWIIKNSWGPNWGEDGYIRLARDRGNMCGVATMASVPEIQ